MRYQGEVFMSKREVIVFSVIDSYRKGDFSRFEAALKLDVSEKTIQRQGLPVGVLSICQFIASIEQGASLSI